jgi:hypothetical protein
MSLHSEPTAGELVVKRPSRARVFGKLGIDDRM